ncbi:uncharacterized protein LOC120726348 isoform X2 [Simochromis diagramma]|uniref:uncharacterized protein LOC120726348 isoform X2 n=1 Tax=Simochromis diagramma TaxID=43689 RepID=UPI001A7E5071|nr:uncharacterized protein LOC120726348 isoform X2 [Simochromis diagramma]
MSSIDVVLTISCDSHTARHKGNAYTDVVCRVSSRSVAMEDHADVAMENKTEVPASDAPSSPDKEPAKPAARQPHRRTLGRRGQRAKRRGHIEKKRGQKSKRRGQEDKKEGVTVKRTWSGGKRRWDKKHYCVFCRRPQVKIARHLLRKHADEQEVLAASTLPTGSKERHLLLEHLRCRGNYLHNIEVIRQGTGEIVPWRQPSEDVDARNYLPCPLCLGFFLRADLWKHQVSCRKKLAINPSKAEANADPANDATSGSTSKLPCDVTREDIPEDSLSETAETGTKQLMTSDPSVDQNTTSDPAVNRARKRTRVQAAASRLLPISSGASESCSEILHRMNQDNVSYEVKSDWLICKYGNKLMGNQDSGQRRYDYVSQKLRELGRLLLAAKSLDSGVQSLQDLLAPGRLSLALSAARKAAGNRWSRPPLAVKTTLKTVCEIAIGESLQDGDWEAAAKTTDFYHMLGREWDNLGLQNPDPAATDGGTKPKKRPVQIRLDKDLRQEVLSKSSNKPVTSVIPPEARMQTSVSVPVAPRKVRRRPWSSAEKEAIWRQLGVHVLVQSVPGLILLFYLIFYLCLAGMFAFTMYILLLTLDDYKPTWQDRLATPGMMIRPKGNQLEITFSTSDTESWDGFIHNLNSFLSPYNDSYQVQTNDECTPDEYFIQEDSGEVRNNPKRSCQFNRTMLEECSGVLDRFYGYDKGQPCILIKLNRVIGMLPGKERQSPYVTCAAKREDSDKIGPLAYYPPNGTFNLMYYPYYGKKAQVNYTQPLVAVKFLNASLNTDINVECKVTSNTLAAGSDRDKFAGRVSFKLRINDK